METTLREARPEKVAVVDEVRARLDGASAAILTEYRGLQVKQMEELRRALTAAGGEYRVYKNTLVRRAARETGLTELEALLEGPTAIAFVHSDVAAVAKVLRDFARANPQLIVKGGLMGRNLIDARTAAALAELPSRDALLAQIAGLLAAPMQRLAGLLQAVPAKFAYALSALIDAKGGVVAEAAPAAPEPEAVTGEVAPAAEDALPEAEAAVGPALEAAVADEPSAAAEIDVQEAAGDEAVDDVAVDDVGADDGAAGEGKTDDNAAAEIAAEEPEGGES